MAAALAGVIHDRQGTDNQEPNRGQYNQNGGFHRDFDHCDGERAAMDLLRRRERRDRACPDPAGAPIIVSPLAPSFCFSAVRAQAVAHELTSQAPRRRSDPSWTST
jgi:hypothetical protein